MPAQCGDALQPRYSTRTAAQTCGCGSIGAALHRCTREGDPFGAAVGACLRTVGAASGALLWLRRAEHCGASTRRSLRCRRSLGRLAWPTLRANQHRTAPHRTACAKRTNKQVRR